VEPQIVASDRTGSLTDAHEDLSHPLSDLSERKRAAMEADVMK
jgi:hypothetical protein